MNDNKHQCRDDQRAGAMLDWEDTPPAGTTQHVKHGDVPTIEFTLRQAEALVEVFGGHDAEVSVMERPATWTNMDPGLYAYFTEYPDEGSTYLGPTEVDDDLAMHGRAPAAPIKTWRERIGQPADFPLHAPTDVERAMEAEIAERRAHGDRCAAAIDLLRDALEHYKRLAPNTFTAREALRMTSDIANYAGQQTATPTGYAMVPLEPTGPMKDAGASQIPISASSTWVAGDVYRAMVKHAVAHEWSAPAVAKGNVDDANSSRVATLLQAAGAMRKVRCHDGSGEPFSAYDKDIADRVVAGLRAEIHALTCAHSPATSADDSKNGGLA